jgi:hypothetical protein
MNALTLREKQAIFAKYLAQLIINANLRGIKVFINELYRDALRQKQLYEQGKTQTLRSLHMYGLAADLIVLKDGKPVLDHVKEYDFLGELWESWGGRWGGRFTSLGDIYHFEYTDRMAEREKGVE